MQKKSPCNCDTARENLRETLWSVLPTQNLRNIVSVASQIENLIIEKYNLEIIQMFLNGLIMKGSQNSLKSCLN